MTSEKPTALDAILAVAPGIDPQIVEATRKAVALLTGLGLLSSKPTEAYRPFNRDLAVGGQASGDPSWSPQRGIQLAKK